jgi:site-specific DNA-methyltransferase (adenine-specific)
MYLVFSKEGRKKEGNKDFIDITKEAFIENTLGVWKIQPEKDRTHPAPFPIELPKRIMQMFTYVGDIVLDCFSGSGTTAVACHNLKRQFICIEKDEDYYKASVERLENAQAQLKLFDKI